MNNSGDDFRGGLNQVSAGRDESVKRKASPGISDPVMKIGRDEMNLADFPLAVLASRPPARATSLVFEDEVWDKHERARVTRRLIVSPCTEYGLPTASDDEVIFGLIQLTYAAGFADRKLSFMPTELFRVLGWRADGRVYSRLEESLRRWVGVTLYYEHAWRDNESKTWMDEHFHLIDSVVISRGRKRQDKKPINERRSRWTIIWNETVFKSFQDGYLRKIDLSVLRQLRTAAAKRMYRFLSKRFYRPSCLTLDLRAFACERIGFSRTYDNSQLKRKLNEPIRQLEQVGFLEPLAREQRYRQVRRGEWTVTLIVGNEWKQKESDRSANEPLEAVLMDRGVKKPVAAKLMRGGSHEAIRQCVREHDELLKSGGGANLTNPPGLLVTSIRERLASCGTGRRQKQPGSAGSCSGWANVQSAPVEHGGGDSAESRRNHEAVRGHLAKLSPKERKSLEADAIREAHPVQRAGYRRAEIAGNRRLLDQYRNVIIDSHVLHLLRKKARNS